MSSTFKNPLYNVVMREADPTDPRAGVECVAAQPVPRSKPPSYARLFEMVENYAASIGAQTCHFSERRPVNSELICMVATYQSGRRDGVGRLNSTFHRYTIFRKLAA